MPFILFRHGGPGEKTNLSTGSMFLLGATASCRQKPVLPGSVALSGGLEMASHYLTTLQGTKAQRCKRTPPIVQNCNNKMWIGHNCNL